MEIKLTIDKAAKSRGIYTQIQLAQEIEKQTGVVLRAATISDMYRNNKDVINKKNLLLVMQGLEITDFNEIITIE
ncbi:hypothetical protein [Psychrobacillus sp. FSL K6-1415]|uniref:hypothetical protein n=1 Tax=Psychrobacillus sp. FSL K6-1415 TaxID=2921544 RepID=UPI0030F89612